jgi:hypothetical protein
MSHTQATFNEVMEVANYRNVRLSTDVGILSFDNRFHSFEADR